MAKKVEGPFEVFRDSSRHSVVVTRNEDGTVDKQSDKVEVEHLAALANAGWVLANAKGVRARLARWFARV